MVSFHTVSRSLKITLCSETGDLRPFHTYSLWWKLSSIINPLFFLCKVCGVSENRATKVLPGQIHTVVKLAGHIYTHMHTAATPKVLETFVHFCF